MKPEKVLETAQHHRALRGHLDALERLRQEDPGIPPGSEHLSFTERYDRMAAYIKLALMAEPTAEGRVTYGMTPAVSVPLHTEEGSFGFLLHFTIEENTRYPEAAISAHWASPDRTEEKGRRFDYEEWIRRADISGDETNAFLQAKLNNLEWSFLKFKEVASALDPSYALEDGFSEGFLTARESAG